MPHNSSGTVPHGGGSVSFSSMIHEYIIREHELMEAHDQNLDDMDCVNSESPGKISVHPGFAAVVVFIYINKCRTFTVIIAS